jgi:DNA-binding transcriptional LysR family regulator
LRAVEAGFGLGLLPREFAQRVGGDAVVEVSLEGARAAGHEMYAVYSSRKHLSPKVRALVDYVARRHREAAGGP